MEGVWGLLNRKRSWEAGVDSRERSEEEEKGKRKKGAECIRMRAELTPRGGKNKRGAERRKGPRGDQKKIARKERTLRGVSEKRIVEFRMLVGNSPGGGARAEGFPGGAS